MAAYHLAPALVRLRSEINTLWPGRDRTSDGWIGDTSHAARPSDHNPAPPAGIVRAIDVDKDGMDARALIACAIQDSRVEYIIHAGLIYQRSRGFEPRAYTGVNAHHGHVHISVRHNAALETSTAPWGLAVVAASPVGSGAGTGTSTGLRPAPPITIAPITPQEGFLMALTHDDQVEALRILRNLNAQVTGADGQHPSIASRVIAIEGQVTGLPDALAALPNSVLMTPVSGADPATGQIQTHPAASWLTVMAFRVAAAQSPAAVVDAIPAEIARAVLDELTRRLEG